jgi:hypothetical protein
MDGGIAEKPARKKSQRRQRDKQIKTPCTADEFNAVAAKADAAGMTRAAYSRAVLLGTPGPRSQRRLPVDAQLLRQALALLGKYGSNMNQVAHVLNAEGGRAMLEADIRTELRHWGEIRDAILAALGREPKPAA